jgi:hypothetical protein
MMLMMQNHATRCTGMNRSTVEHNAAWCSDDDDDAPAMQYGA